MSCLGLEDCVGARFYPLIFALRYLRTAERANTEMTVTIQMGV